MTNFILRDNWHIASLSWRRRLHYRRTPGEEYLHELAITESHLVARGVDQKENEDPNLDSGEAANF